MKGRVLIEGRAQGPLLRLTAPLSFWGGVDPKTGRISDPRHPEHDRSVTGTVLAIPSPRGSSSSSAIMLELIARGLAPAALLLGEADAILALGIVIAREMGHPVLPALELPVAELMQLPEGVIKVETDGSIKQIEVSAPQAKQHTDGHR
jgi:predicted aconitase with swiveling domain